MSARNRPDEAVGMLSEMQIAVPTANPVGVSLLAMSVDQATH
jgi:hypothetical protein